MSPCLTAGRWLQIRTATGKSMVPLYLQNDLAPDPGVYDSLSVDEEYVVHSAGYFYTGLFTGNFNPSQYTLTTKDGTKYILDEQNGLLGVETEWKHFNSR